MSIAEQSAAAMWANDAASKWMGFEVAHVDEGTATLTLNVEAHHCNGHGTLHGGISFSLADSAFAFACNSRGQNTVGQAASINYLAPGRLGDTLTATACEVHLKGKTGLYDVVVTNQDGTVIAQFRGQSRAIPGRLIPEDNA